MRADRIVASDDPERVFEPSILLEVTIPIGRTRLFYDHVNGSERDMVLSVVLLNDTASQVPFKYRSGHGGPGTDGIAVGHLASAAFLQATSDSASVLGPNARLPLIARIFGPGANLCAIFEIEVGAPIRAIVAAMSPGVAPSDAIGTLRPARPDGYRRSGIFPLRDFEAPLEIQFGETAVIGELEITSLDGDTVLKGNYSVVRAFDLVLPESTQSDPINLVFEPRGGPATGTFIIDGTSHEVGRTAAGEPVRVAAIAVDAKSPLHVVTTSELNSFYPVRLSVSRTSENLAQGALVKTAAGIPSSTGLTALANANKISIARSRVMEPLATRLVQEPESLLAHRFDVILQLDTSLTRDRQQMQDGLARLFSSAQIMAIPTVDASHGYVAASLTKAELAKLLAADDAARPLIERVWDDHEIHPLLVDSVPLVKGDAAHAAFAALGDGIVWAVLDSGIEQHPHFEKYENLILPAGLSHRDFTADTPIDVPNTALVDPYGHGTHVAGIIAGAWTNDALPSASRATRPDPTAPIVNETLPMRAAPSGVAPRAKLLSMRVLDQNGGGKASTVVAALDEIFRINGYGSTKRIHGVNLSVGYSFDPTWDACGRTPVCEAVNRLVDSGVVVVVAAGNSGDMYAAPMQSSARPVGLLASINDPGNAERAITVASCYNREPFTDGIAASSSKGPTVDGRLKPDVTAPGEHIMSCATTAVKNLNAGADYIEKSGTSMAAPHVSGAIAAYLSARREFIGRPNDIKLRIARHATDLSRDRAFQGAGLINLFAMLAE